MLKEKSYAAVHFTPEVIAAVISKMRELNKDESKSPLQFITLTVRHDDSEWEYDSLEEFLADYRKYKGDATVSLSGGSLKLVLWSAPASACMRVGAPSRAEIEAVFAILEAAEDHCRVTQQTEPDEPPVVFIAHGRSPLWRDLKDHLHEKHGYSVVAYETGARAGHTIRDVLEEMADKSSFALLVMTAEDEQADGTLRARQNVVRGRPISRASGICPRHPAAGGGSPGVHQRPRGPVLAVCAQQH
jgi:hypothetical protein